MFGNLYFKKKIRACDIHVDALAVTATPLTKSNARQPQAPEIHLHAAELDTMHGVTFKAMQDENCAAVLCRTYTDLKWFEMRGTRYNIVITGIVFLILFFAS